MVVFPLVKVGIGLRSVVSQVCDFDERFNGHFLTNGLYRILIYMVAEINLTSLSFMSPEVVSEAPAKSFINIRVVFEYSFFDSVEPTTFHKIFVSVGQQ